MPARVLEWQPARFVLNGLVAAAVHFGTLFLCLEVLGLRSAGLSNTLAAVLGIAASFLGSRYFVFYGASGPPASGQLLKFLTLYGILSLSQGLLLFFWTDLWRFDYRAGFLLGVSLQTILAYLLGRKWVFKQ